MSKRTILLALGIILALIVGWQVAAFASHPEASLPGSNFEIDTNANLKVDDPAPSIDWASVSESRQNDLATGQNDDSYEGGAKEDDTCPGTTTGSIPNNKSDLLTFGAYVEPEAGGPGFLNLFWTRVQEPSGTTLMDFELNQSKADCGNGVNPVRTPGDLLIEYRIEQGGAVASIKVREWTGSEWGPAVDLTGTQAAGTINSTAIPAAESDGLSATDPVSPRTFGEAQLDLDFIFDEGKCESFGSAFIKSRSSDSFTSQMKDFIKPVPVNISNCGQVIIRKQTDPASDPAATQFGYTKAFNTDPATANTFTLGHGQSKTFTNVLFGNGYTVTEDTLPAGWDFANLNCSASTGVTPSISNATVTFDIDNAEDVLDCTYTNRARGTIIVEKITDDGQGSFEFNTSTLPVDPATPNKFTLTTTAPGQAGKDSETFGNLTPGTYDVAENVPAGWNLVSGTCDDGSNPGTIGLSAGETVTCTFHDARVKGKVIIHKQTDPDEDPNTTDFGYTKSFPVDEDPPPGNTFTLKDDGTQTFNNVLFGTGHTVTEDVIPNNYAFDHVDCGASVGVTPSINGATVTFDIDADTDVLECTYYNELQLGALKILKNSTKGGPVSQPGAVFSYDGKSVTDNGANDEDADVGEVCVSGLLPGNYTVDETSPPQGYGDATEQPQTVTVEDDTNCGDNPPGAGATATFTNPPLADIQVNFRDGGSGETSATSITCENTGTTPDTTPATGWDDSVTHEDIAIDPSPRTIDCKIVIDP